MKLLIDIGNTSAKIAIVRGSEMLFMERLSESWTTALQRLTTEFAIDAIVVSCVGNSTELTTALKDLGLTATWLTASTPCAISGVPEGYGADRLAADIGAYNGQHALLVIDAGTCITYDFIVDGRLCGGVISPGVQLRLNAMHDHTALLPHVTPDATEEVPLLASNTRHCMLSAALHGVRFEAEGYVRSLLADYPDLCVVATGGNQVLPSSDIPATYDPLLVMRGLAKVEPTTSPVSPDAGQS